MTWYEGLADLFFRAMEKEATLWISKQASFGKDMDKIIDNLRERISIMFEKRVVLLELLEVRDLLLPIKSHPINREINLPTLELRFQDPDSNTFRIVFIQGKKNISKFINEL